MININQKSGFTLVETLVAITILLLVIVGPMSIISTATHSTNFSSEQVVASFLAQEGIELVQKARDDLVLEDFSSGTEDNSAWQDFLDSSGAFGECVDNGSGLPEACGLEMATNAAGTVSVVDCNAANRDNCRLYINSNDAQRSRYTHNSGGNAETIYFRTINLQPDPSGIRDVLVTSKVTWRTGEQRREQEVEMVTYLYNVYGR